MCVLHEPYRRSRKNSSALVWSTSPVATSSADPRRFPAPPRAPRPCVLLLLLLLLPPPLLPSATLATIASKKRIWKCVCIVSSRSRSRRNHRRRSPTNSQNNCVSSSLERNAA